MTEAEVAAERDRVERFFLEWIETMGLGYWDIRLVFEQSHPEDTESYAVRMAVDSLWEYQNATITVFLSNTATATDADLQEAVAHELGHLFTSELRPPDREHTPAERKAEERVVTQFARALVRAKLRASKPRRGSTKKKVGTTNG